MAITMTLEDAIASAEQTLELWHRVCGEAEEKPWEEINNGLRHASTWSAAAWGAYMRQRMYHQLDSIVRIYRDEQAKWSAS